MRRIWCGMALAAATSVAVSSTRSVAQTMGEIGTTTSMSNTLDSGGGGMNTSPSSYTRGLPQSSGIPAGSDPTNFGDTSRGGSSSGLPNFPSPNVRGGLPSRLPGGATANVAASIPEEPFHWDDMRGADFVRELQNRGTNKRTYRQPALRRAPYRRPSAKYPLPPRGWLSYYLQQDRYKFATRAWNYVTIEDDRGRYPVKYYYRPNSPTILALLANPPRTIRRYNRVIGFKSWRDAMIAGLRPDPISKPEPAPRVLQLASFTKSTGAMRMIEAVYAGQMSPEQFNASVDYVRNVAQEVGSRRETRALTGRTVNQVVLALLGEAPFPTRVVGRRARVVYVPTVQTTTTNVNGGRPGAPNFSPRGTPPNFSTNPTNPNAVTSGSGQENRMDQFDRFSRNAASLRR